MDSYKQCVPSTLHQFLIQWIGDEVEVVHGDTSSFIATADSNSIGARDNFRSLLGLDLSYYELISCTKDVFFCCAKADGKLAKSFNAVKMSPADDSGATGQTWSHD